MTESLVFFYNNFLIKINKMLPLFNFCIKVFARIDTFILKVFKVKVLWTMIILSKIRPLGHPFVANTIYICNNKTVKIRILIIFYISVSMGWNHILYLLTFMVQVLLTPGKRLV